MIMKININWVFFCTSTFSLKILVSFLHVHTTEKQYFSLMYIMHANASINTPFYTHVSSYVASRVHPPLPLPLLPGPWVLKVQCKVNLDHCWLLDQSKKVVYHGSRALKLQCNVALISRIRLLSNESPKRHRTSKLRGCCSNQMTRKKNANSLEPRTLSLRCLKPKALTLSNWELKVNLSKAIIVLRWTTCIALD